MSQCSHGHGVAQACCIGLKIELDYWEFVTKMHPTSYSLSPRFTHQDVTHIANHLLITINTHKYISIYDGPQEERGFVAHHTLIYLCVFVVMRR